METAIEFLRSKQIKTYSRKNHGINAHVEPRKYFVAYEDIADLMIAYGHHVLDEAVKNARIEEVPSGEIMLFRIDRDSILHLKELLSPHNTCSCTEPCGMDGRCSHQR